SSGRAPVPRDLVSAETEDQLPGVLGVREGAQDIEAVHGPGQTAQGLRSMDRTRLADLFDDDLSPCSRCAHGASLPLHPESSRARSTGSLVMPIPSLCPGQTLVTRWTSARRGRGSNPHGPRAARLSRPAPAPSFGWPLQGAGGGTRTRAWPLRRRRLFRWATPPGRTARAGLPCGPPDAA